MRCPVDNSANGGSDNQVDELPIGIGVYERVIEAISIPKS